MSRKEVIGDAVLYLGDAREIVPTLGRIDACVTDPPYGMRFQSNHRTVAHEAIAGDATPDLLAWACSLPADFGKYVFCRWDNLRDVPPPTSAITWVKNNWSMGDLAHEHGRQTELILFYRGESHAWPKGRPNDVIKCDRTGNNYHPSEKPVSLMEVVVEWTHGTVLDPFLGSGSTGVACATLGRTFIGVEINPGFFDIACRRLEEAYRQPRLFSEPAAKKPAQAGLL